MAIDGTENKLRRSGIKKCLNRDFQDYRIGRIWDGKLLLTIAIW
jgi:hypothetical protein